MSFEIEIKNILKTKIEKIATHSLLTKEIHEKQKLLSSIIFREFDVPTAILSPVNPPKNRNMFNP